MDIQAFGVRDDMIAPNCFGTVPDGTCYSDEFIDFLQRDKYKLDSGKSTSVGKYFWPDAVEAAAELQKLTVAGKEYVPNADPNHIFLPGTFTTTNPRNDDIFGLITKRFQAARAKLGDEALAEGVEESRVAMTAAHQARLSENWAELVEVVNDYLRDVAGLDLTVEEKTATGVDGSTYTDIDIEKAIVAVKAEED